MELVQKIKEYIFALNDFSFDDDVRLNSFLAEVKESLRHAFGRHSQYMTFLDSIHFRPLASSTTAEENVRAWAHGKKQLRDLLFVILEECMLKDFVVPDTGKMRDEVLAENQDLEGEDQDDNAVGYEQSVSSSRYEIQSTLSEVVQAFKNKVRVDLATAKEANREIFATRPRRHFSTQDLPRVRIDLRDLNILNDGVEEYLVHESNVLPKDPFKKVLFIPSRNALFNQQVLKFLNMTEVTLVEGEDPRVGGCSIQEQFVGHVAIQMAVVILCDDCWVRLKDDGQESAMVSPSPAVCFQLGYLVSRLGRGRVVALYEEQTRFRLPTNYLDVLYIPVGASGTWRRDLSHRFRENSIAVRDAAPLFFYKS